MELVPQDAEIFDLKIILPLSAGQDGKKQFLHFGRGHDEFISVGTGGHMVERTFD
jgi:hypothetical protein